MFLQALEFPKRPENNGEIIIVHGNWDVFCRGKHWLDCVIFHLELRRLNSSLVEVFINSLSGLFYLLFMNILYKY